jgi:hypothetical protein
MDRYVVLCDCDGGPQPRVIATIDDDRAHGGPIHLAPSVGEYGETGHLSVKFVSNRRGDTQTPVRLHCGGRCGKDIREITDSTAGEVIDKVAPHRSMLPVVQFPSYDDFGPGWDFGERDRFVISFDMICVINSKRRR